MSHKCNHKKEIITTDKVPAAIGPYSVAVSAGNLLFVSGQLGIDAQSGNLAEGVEAQTRMALTNMSAILAAAGRSLADVVKTTVFLNDIADFAKMNAVYAEFFTEGFPARSAFQVAALPKSALVEIEAIALRQCCDSEDCCD